jgi:hypothetical protein
MLAQKPSGDVVSTGDLHSEQMRGPIGHSRARVDAWTSVVPQGILLSAVSTILLLIAGARGWSLAMSRATGDRP